MITFTLPAYILQKLNFPEYVQDTLQEIRPYPVVQEIPIFSL